MLAQAEGNQRAQPAQDGFSLGDPNADPWYKSDEIISWKSLDYYKEKKRKL